METTTNAVNTLSICFCGCFLVVSVSCLLFGQETTFWKGCFLMSENFRQRFLREAGEHPYAWATSLGLPKDLVSAVMRGADDYQPIRRTLQRLSDATGKSVAWWLTGTEDSTPGDVQHSDQPSPAAQSSAQVAGTIAAGSSQVDLKKLELAMRALSEWEEERDVIVSPERRPAVVALLYDYLVKTEASGQGSDALEVVLRALG